MNAVQQAIETLSNNPLGSFPRDALQTLIDHQDEAAPLLLDYLATVAANVEQAIENDQTNLILFALFLLAQFRETRAYRPLIELLGQLDETNDDFLGDLVTEGLSRILASVCDGDITPIQQLAENPKADEFIRAAAFYSLATLTFQQQWPTETLKTYCQDLLSGKLQYEEGYLPYALVNICKMHGFADLLPTIQSAYQQWPEMADFNKLKHVEAELASGPGEHDRSFHNDLITDTIGSLETWHSFQPEAVYVEDDDEEGEDLSWLPPLPGLSAAGQIQEQGTCVRETPKVGRNDPCVCGSGKKFKKCCG